MISLTTRTQLLRVTVSEITLRNMMHREFHGDFLDEKFQNGPMHQYFYGWGSSDTALQILDNPDTREKKIAIGLDRIDHIPLYKKMSKAKIPAGSIGYHGLMDGGAPAGWNIRLTLSKAQFESLLNLYLLQGVSSLNFSVSFNGIHSRLQYPENAFIETDQSGESDSILIMPSSEWSNSTQIDCGLTRFVFDSCTTLLAASD